MSEEELLEGHDVSKIGWAQCWVQLATGGECVDIHQRAESDHVEFKRFGKVLVTLSGLEMHTNTKDQLHDLIRSKLGLKSTHELLEE